MKIGVMLPTFSEGAAVSLEAARAAESAGLHGVFAYNHVWPMRQPGRPAIWPFPLLGAVAASTQRIAFGTLVARVGMTPLRVLAGELVTLDAISGGRLVAGIGTGDIKSSDELAAYGLAYPPADERRRELAELSSVLLRAGVTTWIGGGAAATNLAARQSGAVVNLWSVPAQRVAAEQLLGPVTWAGPWPAAGAGAAADQARELAAAGATWAVFGWPGSVEPLAEAAAAAGLELAES